MHAKIHIYLPKKKDQIELTSSNSLVSTCSNTKTFLTIGCM